MQGAHDVFLPGQRVAAARAEVGHQKGRVGGVLRGGEGFEFGGFFLQATLALVQHGGGFEAAEIKLVDDGEDVDFKEHGLQQRAFHADVQAALVVGGHGYEAAFELEQFEVIDEIAFDEAQAEEVVQFVLREFEGAQRVEFGFELRADFGQRVNRVFIVAAAEFVHAVRLRELVQHDLQHGEFVKVGIEQRADDGGVGHGGLPFSFGGWEGKRIRTRLQTGGKQAV